MINYEYEDLFYDPTATRHLLITHYRSRVAKNPGHFPSVTKPIDMPGLGLMITNSELIEEQFQLEQKISSGDQLEYGSLYSACLEFTVRNLGNVQELMTKDKEISVYFWFNDDSSTLFKIGDYIVDSLELANDETELRVRAYDPLDRLRDIDVMPWLKRTFKSWSENYEGEVTLGNLYDQFTYDWKVYIANESKWESVKNMTFGAWDKLPNAEMKLTLPETVEALSAGQFLEDICELNGCFMQYTIWDVTVEYPDDNDNGGAKFVFLKTYESDDDNKADRIVYARERKEGQTKIDNYITPAVRKVRAFNVNGEWIATYTNGWNKKYSIYAITDNVFLRDYKRRIQEEGDRETWITRKLKLKSPYMQGDDVKLLQETLNAEMHSGLTVDGIFGSATETAVINFQTDRMESGTYTEGVVAKTTVEALELTWMPKSDVPSYVPVDAMTIERELKYKKSDIMSGEDVQYVQERLSDLGFYTGTVTGEYDKTTQNAVKAFQESEKNGRLSGKAYTAGVVGEWTAYALEFNWNPYVKNTEVVELVHEALKNIYKQIKLVRYIPFETDAIGDLCIEVGDKLSIYDKTRDQKVNKTYLLDRTITGITSMFDRMKASGDTEANEFGSYSGSSQSSPVSGGSASSSGGGSTSDSETVNSDNSIEVKGVTNLPEVIRNFGMRVLAEPSNVSIEMTPNGPAIKWKDPPDITNNKPCPVTWAGTKVIRKKGSAPLNPWDFKKTTGGVLVISTVRDEYADTAIVDDGTVLPPVNPNSKYYYAIMPYDTDGHYRWTKVLKMPELQPGEIPMILEISQNGGKLTVTYDLNNGNLSKAVLVYNANHIPSGSSDGTALELDTALTSISIPNMGTGLLYYFMLYVTRFGEEIDSDPYLFQTAEFIPYFYWDCDDSIYEECSGNEPYADEGYAVQYYEDVTRGKYALSQAFNIDGASGLNMVKEKTIIFEFEGGFGDTTVGNEDLYVTIIPDGDEGFKPMEILVASNRTGSYNPAQCLKIGTNPNYYWSVRSGLFGNWNTVKALISFDENYSVTGFKYVINNRDYGFYSVPAYYPSLLDIGGYKNIDDFKFTSSDKFTFSVCNPGYELFDRQIWADVSIVIKKFGTGFARGQFDVPVKYEFDGGYFEVDSSWHFTLKNSEGTVLHDYGNVPDAPNILYPVLTVDYQAKIAYVVMIRWTGSSYYGVIGSRYPNYEAYDRPTREELWRLFVNSIPKLDIADYPVKGFQSNNANYERRLGKITYKEFVPKLIFDWDLSVGHNEIIRNIVPTLLTSVSTTLEYKDDEHGKYAELDIVWSDTTSYTSADLMFNLGSISLMDFMTAEYSTLIIELVTCVMGNGTDTELSILSAAERGIKIQHTKLNNNDALTWKHVYTNSDSYVQATSASLLSDPEYTFVRSVYELRIHRDISGSGIEFHLEGAKLTRNGVVLFNQSLSGRSSYIYDNLNAVYVSLSHTAQYGVDTGKVLIKSIKMWTS